METINGILARCRQMETANRRDGFSGIPLLRKLRDLDLSKGELFSVAAILSEVDFFLPMIQKFILNQIQVQKIDEETKAMLLAAVHDDIEYDSGREVFAGQVYTHNEALQGFVETLGVDYQVWKMRLGVLGAFGEIHQSSKSFLTDMMIIIQRGAFDALATLWFLHERCSFFSGGTGVGDYYFLLQNFEKFEDEFETAQMYLSVKGMYSHVRAEAIKTVMEKLSGLAGKEVENFCSDIHTAFTRYWENIYHETAQ